MKPWFMYTMGAFLCWGVWGFLCKLAAIKGMNWKGIYVFNGLGYIPLIIFFIFSTRLQLPGSVGAKSIAVVAGVAGTLAALCLYAAIANGKLAIILPLSSLYPAFSIVLAVIFLKETLSAYNIAGIVLAMIAIVLLTYE